jgi:flagellar biosynthesis GTPase FlhF
VEETPTRKSGGARWRSTWVIATATGILGLILGTAVGTSGNTAETSEEVAAVQERLAESQAEVQRLRNDAEAADAQLAQRESDLKAREAAVAQKEQAVTARESEVKAREDAVAEKEQAVTAREQAVADAEQRLANDRAAAEQQAPTVQTPPPAPQQAGPDPRFSTCAEPRPPALAPTAPALTGVRLVPRPGQRRHRLRIVVSRTLASTWTHPANLHSHVVRGCRRTTRLADSLHCRIRLGVGVTSRCWLAACSGSSHVFVPEH